MSTKKRSVSAVVRCSICGREIASGEEYWVCNGTLACTDCLPDLARQELLPCPGAPGKGGQTMTLLEMSVVYAEHAAVIRSRIVELRGLTRQETDPEAVQALKRRVAALLPLWQEARDLARLTAHYYDYDKEAHR